MGRKTTKAINHSFAILWPTKRKFLSLENNDPALTAAGQRIEYAVKSVLRDGKALTPDLNGQTRTHDPGVFRCGSQRVEQRVKRKR